MEDRFENLPETFNEMMLLPYVPDFRTSHRSFTKIHQIKTAGCALLKKEESNQTKGWTVPIDSTRRDINPPLVIIQHKCFFPCRCLLLCTSNREGIVTFSCNDDLGKP